MSRTVGAIGAQPPSSLLATLAAPRRYPRPAAARMHAELAALFAGRTAWVAVKAEHDGASAWHYAPSIPPVPLAGESPSVNTALSTATSLHVVSRQDGEVVIEARPAGLSHREHPFALEYGSVLALTPELEMLEGLRSPVLEPPVSASGRFVDPDSAALGPLMGDVLQRLLLSREGWQVGLDPSTAWVRVADGPGRERIELRETPDGGLVVAGPDPLDGRPLSLHYGDVQRLGADLDALERWEPAAATGGTQDERARSRGRGPRRRRAQS